MTERPLSLCELHRIIREVLALSLDGPYWVAAELSRVNFVTKGHCYLELMEKDADNGRLLAKGSAVIWSQTANSLLDKFALATGCTLSPGIKVLLKVVVSFHEVFGMQCIVHDIDPSYTLGDLQRRRQEILHQLQAEGVADLNQSLPLPRPLLRIAVISSHTAAGYGDFCHQLNQSPYAFHIRLFPATMQGEDVERSIIAAIDSILASEQEWDAVAIIRGGGAVSDLNGFDTYLLAATVAQCPIPVLTGIGHERDETILDLVAHTRFKTPTAVAAFLVAQASAEADTLTQLSMRTAHACRTVLQREALTLSHCSHRLQQAVHNAQETQARHLQHLSNLMYTSAQGILFRQQMLLDNHREALPRSIHRILQHETETLTHIAEKIALVSPTRILELGYTLTRRTDGSILRSAKDAVPGQKLVTQFIDGTLESTVNLP